MNICIPVIEDRGLASPVNPHFGSAPSFVVVNAESGSCRGIPNANQHHSHGACQPLRSLEGQGIDAVVVGGIGMGALMKLQAAGIRVFSSQLATVEETMAAFRTGSLPEVSPATACAHHGHGTHDHSHAK